SLDEKPLAESSKVLVQVGTRARPSGWVEHAETFPGADGKTTYQGKKVDDTGKMPWLIAEAKLKLAVKNGKLKTATTLDLNGKPRGDAKAMQEKGFLTFTFPGDAMYVVLRGE